MTSLPLYISRQQVDLSGLKHDRSLPYGLTPEQVATAMNDVLDYIHRINRISIESGYERLEELMLGNTYSGFISELIVKAIARRCPDLVRNTKVGGHPDLIPKNRYPGEAILRGDEGIEVKVSLQSGGWQGHNPENGWIMVFQISVDRETEPVETRQPLQFEKVMLALLRREHWIFRDAREQVVGRQPPLFLRRVRIYYTPVPFMNAPDTPAADSATVPRQVLQSNINWPLSISDTLKTANWGIASTASLMYSGFFSMPIAR